MDTWPGRSLDPVTLNKYLYTNGDPINFTDPSGHFAFTLTGISAGQSIMNGLAVVAVYITARVVLDRLVDVLFYSPIAEELVEQAIEGQRNKLNFKWISYGQHIPEHTDHIGAALKGRGSSLPGGHPGYLRATSQLNKKDKGLVTRSFLNALCGKPRPAGKACDEYPFASSFQGGYQAWLEGKISLKLLSDSESKRQGNFMYWLYRYNNMTDYPHPDSAYSVFAIPHLPSAHSKPGGGIRIVY